jgi:uncharacterized membrane protein YphA (DoxX/SURF4 family)
MGTAKSDNSDRGQTTLRSALGEVGLVLLRLVVGWHFLYEGLVKLFDPGWTAKGYLLSSEWLLADVFHWMAETPNVLAVVEQLNIWGLILIGAALMLGVFTRSACILGALLLGLYYVANPPLPGFSAAGAEGSYLIVNKVLVEMAALLVIAMSPSSNFAGMGRYLRAALRAVCRFVRGLTSSGDAPLHQDPERFSRREIIASLATLPVIGGFIYALMRKRSREEEVLADGLSGATFKVEEALSLDKLKAPVATAKLGHLDVSRLIMGGNLMNGYAHARDLMYVSPLVKNYHTLDKILETLWLGEQCGINTLIINTKVGGAYVEAYHQHNTGDMNFIAQCRANDLMPRVQLSIDMGCRGAYVQSVEHLVDKNEFDAINAALERLRQNGLVAGIGSHHLAPIKSCIEQGIEVDFVMKTFHHDNYWSARPDEKPRDNRYCDDGDETIEFMRDFDKPWIAFKTLAAGAIHPRDGFRYAFQNGADFICVGIYDFQMVSDANITHDVLHADLDRDRPWIA